MTLRLRALKFLARREHSRAELARKLAAHGETDAVEALLDQLEQENLLSDSRYAEQLAHARAGKHGSLRLRAELREKGVSENEMVELLQTAREQDWLSARAIWQKKFGATANEATSSTVERARQFRYLANRGFPSDVIRRVIGGCDEE